MSIFTVQKWVVFLLYCLSANMQDIEAQTVSNSSHTPKVMEKEVQKKVQDKIRFFLYPNPEDTTDTQELLLEEPHLIMHSNFSKNRPVKFLIHGFNGDCTDLPFPIKPMEEYLKLQQETNDTFNLICVDWGPWSRYDGLVNFLPTYILGRIQYAPQISRKVASLVIFLRDTKLITNLSHVHLIGLSLGAHIAGSTGYIIQEMIGQKVGRISGLDPAGPLYREWPDLDEQLDRSDADFVDVYHTSMKRAGLEGKYGHVDFYVNGGVTQPSCVDSNPSLQNLAASISEGILGGCSHNIVANYWADAIRNPEIKACKTESYAEYKRAKKLKTECSEKNSVIFGENVPTSARGKYFLDLDTKYTPEKNARPRRMPDTIV